MKARVALVSVLALAGMAAAADPLSRCGAAKLMASGKRSAADLRCYVAGTAAGRSVDPTCLARSGASFTAAYADAEDRGGCAILGDAGSVSAQIAAFASTLDAALPGGTTKTTRRCAAKKLRAAGTKARQKLKCHAVALLGGSAVDTGCLARAEMRFVAAFARADAAGACTGAASVIESLVDGHVTSVVGTTTGATTSTVTTSTSSTTSTTPPVCSDQVCDGVCPPNEVCGPNFSTFTCQCFSTFAPCEDTYGACVGTCSGGGTCRPTGPQIFGSCTCAPPGSLCSDGPFPTCGGGCATGLACFPTRAPLLGQALEACTCGDPAIPCGPSGIACLAGFVCTLTSPGGPRVCVP